MPPEPSCMLRSADEGMAKASLDAQGHRRVAPRWRGEGSPWRLSLSAPLDDLPHVRYAMVVDRGLSGLSA